MLTTVALLKKNWLDIEAMNTEHDTAIEACITQAGKLMSKLCGQPLESTAETIYFRGGISGKAASDADIILGGAGGAEKKLFYTVPVSLTALYYRTVPTDSWATVSGAVVYTSDNLWRLYVSTGFYLPFYKATLAVGFDTIPDDLVLAASELATEIYNELNKGGKSKLGVSSTSTTQGGVTVTTQYEPVLKHIQPTLDLYTRRTA